MASAQALAAARAEGRKLADLARDFEMSVKRVRRYLSLAECPQELQELVARGGLPMEHARLLARAGVRDPVEWARRTAIHRWSAKELDRELRHRLGKGCPGRKRTYLRREKDSIRFYAFRIGRGAPSAERARVIELLERAIDFLRD